MKKFKNLNAKKMEIDEIRFEANTFDHVEMIYERLLDHDPKIGIHVPLDVADDPTLEGQALMNTVHYGVVETTDPDTVKQLIANYGGFNIGDW